MNSFYAQDDICPDCGFEGEQEKTFENIWSREAIQDIIYVCRQCGCATLRGQRIDDQEFYY